MLEVLDKHFLSPKETAFYDVNAKSMIELVANFHAKLNECVKEINDFTSGMDAKMKEFVNSDQTAKEEHMTAIRQEFQDFIDIINLKVMELQNSYSIYDGELDRWKKAQETARETFENRTNTNLEEWKDEQETVITDAKKYMVDNLVQVAGEVAREELANQNITVELSYNPETEDLSIAYGGGN